MGNVISESGTKPPLPNKGTTGWPATLQRLAKRQAVSYHQQRWQELSCHHLTSSLANPRCNGCTATTYKCSTSGATTYATTQFSPVPLHTSPFQSHP